MMKAWRVMGEKKLVAEKVFEQRESNKKTPKKKVWKCKFH